LTADVKPGLGGGATVAHFFTGAAEAASLLTGNKGRAGAELLLFSSLGLLNKLIMDVNLTLGAIEPSCKIQPVRNVQNASVLTNLMLIHEFRVLITVVRSIANIRIVIVTFWIPFDTSGTVRNQWRV